jgi:hypothetical protein
MRHTQEILSICEVTTMVAAGEGPTPARPENGGSSRFLTRRLYTILYRIWYCEGAAETTRIVVQSAME